MNDCKSSTPNPQPELASCTDALEQLGKELADCVGMLEIAVRGLLGSVPRDQEMRDSSAANAQISPPQDPCVAARIRRVLEEGRGLRNRLQDLSRVL